MDNGEDGAERSVSDVLAAIRARVQAEEAGLSSKVADSGEAPLRLTADQQVEDAQVVSPPRTSAPPLRLDSPVPLPKLRLADPVQPDGQQPEQAQPDPMIEDVPEAPHIQIDDEQPIGDEDNVTALFGTASDDEPAEVAQPEDIPAAYDVWNPGSAVEPEPEAPQPSEGYDVWKSGQRGYEPDDTSTLAAANTDLPDTADQSASGIQDPDLVRALVREVLEESAAVDTDGMRAQIRAIIAEELDGEHGRAFARSIRKSIRKDIVRAFKDRGLN